MARFRWLPRVACGLAMIGADACGLDEVGLMPDDASVDGTRSDASADVAADTIQSCVTLDASACVDASVPDGWTLIAYAPTAATCPTAFNTHAYARNPTLEAGACACTCSASGSYSCGGSLAYGSSCGNCGGGLNGCSSKGTATLGADGGCVPSSFNSPDIAFGSLPTAAAVNVGCDAGLVGNQPYNTQPATVCAPQCAADYCGSLGSLKKCIISNQPTCPPPFAPIDTIGAPGDVKVSCTACTCTTSQGGDCNGTLAYYGNSTSCGGTPQSATANSCHQTGGTSVGSFSYTVTPPTVACTASEGEGGAAFNAPMTVCCLN